ncbi:ABC transporter permease [Tumebacillus sp. DT12]|uniref:ABC transporter permease n=1 Tax=Tumebacillus lacus TaxID=2995335 RepID=A0ABT3X6N8_9BACL|nr:ABC transporter permease [Tumebacillus lacus]MCX7571647.1 ABC transporter permease [Tumebacillus lacus]
MGTSERLNMPLVWGLRILCSVLFFGAWEYAVRLGWLDPFFFSSPVEIYTQIIAWLSGQEIYYDIYITIGETLLGFAIGVLIGMVTGFVFARTPMLAAVFDPLFVVLNAMPKLALGPLFIIWFGIGISSKVAMAVVIVLFLVFFNTYQGVREVSQDLINNARILGASRWSVLRHVLFPSALGWIFSSLRTSIGYALIGAVVGEYMVAQHGVGHLIASAQANFDTTGVFSGLIILMLLVWVIDVVIQRVEEKLTAWRGQA